MSDDLDEQRRASFEAADEGVWIEIIERFLELWRWVAHNKTISLDILRTLAVDPNPEVRWAVASKRKLDRELFELLAQDPEPFVRHRIASNQKTPADLLAQRANDADVFVAKSAAERA